MNLSKTKKIRKLLAALDPKDEAKLLVANLADDLKEIEKKIPVVKDYSPVIKALREELIARILELPNADELDYLRSEFETKLASLEKENIEPIQEQMQDIVSNDITTDETLREDLDEKLKKLRLEFLNRINNLGGGAQNQQININGSVMSTKYADINFIPGSVMGITKDDDIANKRVNVTISGIPSSIAGAIVGGSNTQLQFNDNGVFGGASVLTWNKNSSVLAVNGNVGIGVTEPVSMLELPGSTTNSSGKFGTFELQSFAINNAWLGDNLYYNSGFKRRAAGYGVLQYFNGGNYAIGTANTGSAGAAATLNYRFQLLGSNAVAGGLSPGDFAIGGDMSAVANLTGATLVGKAGNAYVNKGLTVGDLTTDPGDNNVYVVGDVSALTFTDRTPFYEGDALAEIKAIKGVNGEIDHATLPDFAKKTIVKNILNEVDRLDKEGNPVLDPSGNPEKEFVKVGEEEEPGRDLGAMISVLTKAVQQLTARVEELEK